MKNSYLGQAWLVLVLGLTFGAALAGVHVALNEKIEQNKKNEALRRIPQLVPGARAGNAKTIAGMTVYDAVDDAGRHVGYVIRAVGSGFNDKIELLIGLDASAANITGLYVLDQKETPGLGSKITDQDWLDQFSSQERKKQGRSPLSTAKQLDAKKGEPGDSEIKAVTGATISSASVCRTINDAVAKIRGELGEPRRTSK